MARRARTRRPGWQVGRCRRWARGRLGRWHGPGSRAGHRRAGARPGAASPEVPWDLVGAELLAAGEAPGRRRAAPPLGRLRSAGSTAPLAGTPRPPRPRSRPAGRGPWAPTTSTALCRTLARTLAEHHGRSPRRTQPGAVHRRARIAACRHHRTRPRSPFVAENGGSRWVLAPLDAAAGVDGVAVPLLGLVCLAATGTGRIFVDLESCGRAICVAGDLDRALQRCRRGRGRAGRPTGGPTICASCWWAFGSALAPISEDRLRCVDSLDEVVEGVTDRAVGRKAGTVRGRESTRAIGRGPGSARRRRDPDFLSRRPVRPPRSSSPSCRTGSPRPARRRSASLSLARCRQRAWWFEIDAAECRAPAAPVTVRASRSTARSYAALARLIRAEAAVARPEPTEALLPAWVLVSVPVYEPVGELARAAPAAAGRPDREPAGCCGSSVNRPWTASIGCCWVCRWRWRSSASSRCPAGRCRRALAASVWLYGVTVAERDAKLLPGSGDWLGTDADGNARLPAGPGRRAAPVRRCAARSGTCRRAGRAWRTSPTRRAALELARGPLLEPHLPRRHHLDRADPVAHEMPAFVVECRTGRPPATWPRAGWTGRSPPPGPGCGLSRLRAPGTTWCRRSGARRAGGGDLGADRQGGRGQPPGHRSRGIPARLTAERSARHRLQPRTLAAPGWPAVSGARLNWAGPDAPSCGSPGSARVRQCGSGPGTVSAELRRRVIDRTSSASSSCSSVSLPARRSRARSRPRGSSCARPAPAWRPWPPPRSRCSWLSGVTIDGDDSA